MRIRLRKASFAPQAVLILELAVESTATGFFDLRSFGRFLNETSSQAKQKVAKMAENIQNDSDAAFAKFYNQLVDYGRLTLACFSKAGS